MKIELKEFESLPTKQKFNCLYENQCETIRLIRGYKTYYRINCIIGGFLIIGMGILFRLHLL